MKSVKQFFRIIVVGVGLLFTLIVKTEAGGMVISPVVVSGGGGTSTIREDNTDLGFGSGSVTFNHWIEQASLNGTASFWTIVPIVYSGTTSIQMFYNGTPLVGSFSTVFTKNYEETGLKGLWHLDEGSGLTANDSSGLGNTGTLVNGPVWQSTDGGQWDGRSDVKFNQGSALSFDGVDDYVGVSVNPFYQSNFTVEAWVKFNAVGGINNSIVGGGIASDSQGLHLNERDSKAMVGFYANDTNGNQILSANVWYHLVFMYDGAQKIYINGNLDVSRVTSAYNNSTLNIMIGSNPWGGYRMNGIIDEVRFYNRALSADEIKSHYERRKYTSGTITVTYGSEQTNPGTIYPNLSKMRAVTIINSGTTPITGYQLNVPVRIGISNPVTVVKD